MEHKQALSLCTKSALHSTKIHWSKIFFNSSVKVGRMAKRYDDNAINWGCHPERSDESKYRLSDSSLRSEWQNVSLIPMSPPSHPERSVSVVEGSGSQNLDSSLRSEWHLRVWESGRDRKDHKDCRDRKDRKGHRDHRDCWEVADKRFFTSFRMTECVAHSDVSTQSSWAER